MTCLCRDCDHLLTADDGELCPSCTYSGCTYSRSKHR